MEWAPTAQSMFLVNIQVEALDRNRLLSDITKVLSDVHVNILAALAADHPRPGRQEPVHLRDGRPQAPRPRAEGGPLGRRRLRRLPRHPVDGRVGANARFPVVESARSADSTVRSRRLGGFQTCVRADSPVSSRGQPENSSRALRASASQDSRASMAAVCSSAFLVLPAATALSRLASRSASEASSWATVSAARARASGLRAPPLVVLGAADGLLDLPHPALEVLHPVAGDLAGRVPALGDVPERLLGGLQVGDRHQGLGLDEQRLLLLRRSRRTRGPARRWLASRAPKKVSWAPRNRFHSASSTPLGRGRRPSTAASGRGTCRRSAPTRSSRPAPRPRRPAAP